MPITRLFRVNQCQDIQDNSGRQEAAKEWRADFWRRFLANPAQFAAWAGRNLGKSAKVS